MQEIEQRDFLERRNKNKQLLHLLRKLIQLQQSAWGQFLRFEKSQLFKSFDKKFSVPNVIQIKLDDIIYLLMLLGIIITFCILPSQNQHVLTAAFRQYLVILYVCSFFWLFTSHYFKHVLYSLFLIVFPALTILSFFNIIVIGDHDSSLTFESYVGYWSFPGVYLICILVYPLKQFIRRRLGSLYSYLYALSFTTLFGIWPVYSLIEQYLVNAAVTFAFVANNKPLIITFIVIIVVSFYLFTHSTFFQGDKKKVVNLLLRDFSKGQLTQLIDDVDENQSCIYNNYNLYSRIMSVIVLTTTLATEIYLFLYLSDNLGTIWETLSFMVFLLVFLIYGSIVNRVPFGKDKVFFVLGIISLIPVCLSPLYYTPFSFYDYIFLGTGWQYSTIFWCLIRAIPSRRPILRMNIIVTTYSLVHIPVILFMINSLEYLTSEVSIISIINYVIFGVVGLVILLGAIGVIVWLIQSIREIPGNQEEDVRRPIDYYYHQEGNPPYIPYTPRNVFSLQWLVSLDLRSMGYLGSIIFFMGCQTTTMFILNQLMNTYASTVFFSEIIREIIYAQFPIVATFYVIGYYYIAAKNRIVLQVIISILLFCIGVTGLVLSYIVQVFPFSFRIYGGCCLLLLAIFIAFEFIKHKNQDISNFLCSMLIVVTWIILIIPYVIVFPMISIFISQPDYGLFVYNSILVSVVILIVVITAVSIIFNTIMNKFDAEKKVKFMTEDVKTYLNDQGVQANDQYLYILYQSYENRDKRYVYFLKRGFPVNVIKNQDEQYKLITYDKYLLKHSPSKLSEQQMTREDDPVWKFLTFCCGKDDDQIQNNLQQIALANNLGEQQLLNLLPQDFIQGLINDDKFSFLKQNRENQKQMQDKKNYDPSKAFSSKSPVLKSQKKTKRHLGDDYVLLKAKKQLKLAVQLWHYVFQFIANKDYRQECVIFNDLLSFCNMAGLQIKQLQLTNLYFRFAKTNWSNIMALNIDNFTVFVEYLAQINYPSIEPRQNRKMEFLIRKVYYNMSQYDSFQEQMIKTNFKKSNLRDFKNSPFYDSLAAFEVEKSQYEKNNNKFRKRKHKHQDDKFIQPNQVRDFKMGEEQVSEQKPKQESCKRKTYDKYIAIKKCCSRQDLDKQIVKRSKIKPWDYLAVQCVQLLQQKQVKWGDEHGKKDYKFRISFNNIVMALFKLLDLYTYLEITIRDPNIEWIQDIEYSYLFYIEYKYQLYIALGLILITIPLGVYGIYLILQDRLGLNQSRMPAAFPEPMFIFTSLYKILVYSAFVTIALTLLLTFSCTWTSTTANWTLHLDPNLICFETQHNIYLLLSIVGLIVYYPLSAYTMPNFQFADKILDLKFRPSYLIIYFQMNFILVAGKALLSPQGAQSQSIQIVFISLNIASLFFLSIAVLWMKPCLIEWFNYIELLVTVIGLIFNVMGLVLYITGQWVLCLVLAISLSIVACLIIAVYIKKAYFSDQTVFNQSPEQVQELQQHWDYYKKKHLSIAKEQDTHHGSKKVIGIRPIQVQQLGIQSIKY